MGRGLCPRGDVLSCVLGSSVSSENSAEKDVLVVGQVVVLPWGGVSDEGCVWSVWSSADSVMSLCDSVERRRCGFAVDCVGVSPAADGGSGDADAPSVCRSAATPGPLQREYAAVIVNDMSVVSSVCTVVGLQTKGTSAAGAEGAWVYGRGEGRGGGGGLSQR